MRLIFILFFIFVCILIFTPLLTTHIYKEHFTNNKEQNYVELLKKTANALNGINVPFFLSSGTCLGYYRENKIMDHDYDIDIGVLRKDFNPNILDAMKKQGFLLKRTVGDLENGLEYQFLYPNTPLGRRARVDIFVHYDELKDGKNYIYWTAQDFKQNPPKKIKYRVSHFNIKKTKFYNIDVGVPENTEKYLEEHYGFDWRIPKSTKTGYYYASSPTSIVKD